MEKTQNQNEQIEVRLGVSGLSVEQREGASGRTISGYAARFDSWSDPIYGWFKEKIARGAFDGCDMADVIMVFNHDIGGVLARSTSGTLKLSVDEQGLRFEFEAPNTQLGNDMVELVSRGDISKCSFKFTVSKDEWVYADEKNGLKYDERTITGIGKLYDVSLVTYPAYPDTSASVREALEQRKREFTAPARIDTSDRDRAVAFLKLKH